MKIVSRREAMSLGLKRYYTGIPCSHGHVSERYTNMTRCVECHSDRQIDQNAKQKQLSPIVRNMLLEAQDHKCALCLTVVTDKRWVVDHCHTTGEIRAVLCLLCNNMLGAAKDNPDVLRAGAKYIELFKDEPVELESRSVEAKKLNVRAKKLKTQVIRMSDVDQAARVAALLKDCHATLQRAAR